jgi:hypothetical protein
MVIPKNGTVLQGQDDDSAAFFDTHPQHLVREKREDRLEA